MSTSIVLRLYKKLYRYLVSKAVPFNLRYERNDELRAINIRYFTDKLMSFIDPACVEIDKKYRWLTLMIMTYLCLIVASFTISFTDAAPHKEMIQPLLSLFGFLLAGSTFLKSTKAFKAQLEEPLDHDLAEIILLNVPVLLIQFMLGSCLMITASFMNLATVFSALALLAFAIFNQYNMVCSMMTKLECKDLSYDEMSEYLALTVAFYSYEVRGQILFESMDGGTHSIIGLSERRMKREEAHPVV